MYAKYQQDPRDMGTRDDLPFKTVFEEFVERECTIIPGMPIPEGVPERFALKQEATLEFTGRGSSNPAKLGNMKGERAYRDYFNDLVGEDRKKWLAFFDERDNSEHAEHTRSSPPGSHAASSPSARTSNAVMMMKRRIDPGSG